MFTGIIESFATVEEIQVSGTNKDFRLASPLAREFKVDQSVSHDGVCLTVTRVSGEQYWVTAVNETLSKSTLSTWKVGHRVNLERCMVANGRFDGHVVQGHVDQTGRVTGIAEQGGSWLIDFSYDEAAGNVTVEKGSISVNGVSLTCFNSKRGRFSVAIIPYTFEHTNMGRLKVGDAVNLEFDIIGKYVKRLLKLGD